MCVDCVCRLWEEGWKQRYYKTKFDVDASDEDFRKKVVQSYVEGLCWVLRYYYQVSGQLFIPSVSLRGHAAALPETTGWHLYVSSQNTAKKSEKSSFWELWC